MKKKQWYEVYISSHNGYTENEKVMRVKSIGLLNLLMPILKETYPEKTHVITVK